MYFYISLTFITVTMFFLIDSFKPIFYYTDQKNTEIFEKVKKIQK